MAAGYVHDPEDDESPTAIVARNSGKATETEATAAARAELAEKLSDPNWRLLNLYYIRDKEGKTVLFKPWPEQEKFFKNIWYRNIVPKARQRGFSTAIQLLWLDTCLFTPNIAAAIIAQTDGNAQKIFDDKIKFAWDRLPQWLKDANPAVRMTLEEIKWANGSFLYVSVSPRGSTLQRLHVSELGQIASKYPLRAKEVQRGALPAVDKHGIIVVESTVESPHDMFSEMVKTAMATAESGKTLSNLEYRLHFASWWDADEYEADPDLIVISPEEHAYFDKLETKINRSISPAKRAWYVGTLHNSFSGEQESMWSQYPSTLEEAFQVSSEGIYYAKQLSAMRKTGRICPVPYDPRYPVDTWWDIGVSDDIAIVFTQKVAGWTNIIDFFECSNEPYDYVVREGLETRPYVFGNHNLPHDANQRRPGVTNLKTPKDMLEDLKLKHIRIISRIAELQHGIDQTRLAFASARIDEAKCKALIVHLEGYSKSWNETQGTWSNEPKKNGHQHAADAVRQWGQSEHSLKSADDPKKPNRPQRRRSGMAS